MEPSYGMWNLTSTQSVGTLLNHCKNQILAANVLSLMPLFLILTGKMKRGGIIALPGKYLLG